MPAPSLVRLPPAMLLVTVSVLALLATSRPPVKVDQLIVYGLRLVICVPVTCKAPPLKVSVPPTGRLL